MKRILSGFLVSLFMVNQCFAATGWLKTKPAGADSPSTIDDSTGENSAALDLMLAGYREGCQLTYSAAGTIAIGAGEVMVANSDGSVRLMVRNAAATTATFTDIDTGSEAASTTYYVYAVASGTTATTFTLKISASATTPTGVTYYRRLGSFYNDGSSNITDIVNDNARMKYYDSGWFAASANSSYAKSHNLGTARLLVTVFFGTASDNSGTVCQVGNQQYFGDAARGCPVIALTATSITLRTGTYLLDGHDASSAHYYPTSGYLRIIANVVE